MRYPWVRVPIKCHILVRLDIVCEVRNAHLPTDDLPIDDMPPVRENISVVELLMTVYTMHVQWQS